MVGDPQPEGRSVESASSGARATQTLHRLWANRRSRRRIVIAAGLVVAIAAIAVVVSLFASLAGESQSYRDGYSAGGSAYSAYSNLTAGQACRNEQVGPGGRPTHDNPTEWIAGCVDAFDLARSDN